MIFNSYIFDHFNYKPLVQDACFSAGLRFDKLLEILHVVYFIQFDHV